MEVGNLMGAMNSRVFGAQPYDKWDVAKMLFFPIDKSPYQLGVNPIRNFFELNEMRNTLHRHEATWVADWLEYLGDTETASSIYEHPQNFRTIINERYRSLYVEFSQ
jgi:hypothetical protein